jgi:hypothetical protein
VANNITTLPGEGAADDENARVWAKSAHLDSFFNASDGEPASSRIDYSWCAQLEGMTIRIGLDDREEFNLWASELGEQTIIVFDCASRNFNPAGARMHQTVQSTV